MLRRRRTRDREVDLDDLIRANWSEGVLFYTRFLNMRPGLHLAAYDKSTNYRRFIRLQQSLDFARDMSYILGAILSDGTGRDLIARTRLDQALNGSTFEVGIDHSRHTITISGRELLETLWLKFVFEIVVPGFQGRILSCPACMRWMPKHRANQIYCDKNCRDYFNLYMKSREVENGTGRKRKGADRGGA